MDPVITCHLYKHTLHSGASTSTCLSLPLLRASDKDSPPNLDLDITHRLAVDDGDNDDSG